MIRYCPVEVCQENGTWSKPSISCASKSSTSVTNIVLQSSARRSITFKNCFKIVLFFHIDIYIIVKTISVFRICVCVYVHFVSIFSVRMLRSGPVTEIYGTSCVYLERQTVSTLGHADSLQTQVG